MRILLIKTSDLKTAATLLTRSEILYYENEILCIRVAMDVSKLQKVKVRGQKNGKSS